MLLKNKKLTPTLLTLSLPVFLFFACAEAGKKGEDAVEVAEEHNEQKFDNEKEKTADFLVYAADLNLHEIQLGELALGNAFDPAVKKLGKMMADDHRKLQDELNTVASERQVTLPENVSDEHKKDCDKLGKKKGKDFDKAYTDAMVEGHEKAIKRFEKEAEAGADEKVRRWAFDRLPALRTHLDHAIDCQKKCSGAKDTAVVVKNKDIEDPKEKKRETKEAPAKKSDW